MELNIAKVLLDFKETAQQRIAFLCERSHMQDYEIRRLKSELLSLRQRVEIIIEQNLQSSFKSFDEQQFNENDSIEEDDVPPF
tara:strand:+ start:165 stop:413 length:249 start_codon:yes stop_codon:yes gene_type:complete